MARAISDDFLMNMRFFVTVDGPVSFSKPSQGTDSSPSAGFSACTVPEGNVAIVEYREGQYVYTRKQPGIPSMSDITLSRGVAKKDSSFYRWWRLCAEEGSDFGEYRGDVTIKHYHRDVASVGAPSAAAVSSTKARFAAQQGGARPDALNIGRGSEPPATRQYVLFEAWVPRHKPATDLDANSGEISVMEIDITYESFVVYEGSDIPGNV